MKILLFFVVIAVYLICQYHGLSTRSHFNVNNMSCPVSSILDPQSIGLNNYPLKLYDVNMVQFESFKDPLNCSAVNFGHPMLYENLQCVSMNSSICPFNKQIISNFVKNSRPTNSSRSLCSPFEALHNNNQTINIIISGESATIGSNARGCCCDRDNRCDKFQHFCHDYQGDSSDTHFYDLAVRNCSWPQYFFIWLDHHFNSSNIRKIRMDGGGLSSKMAAERLPDVLRSHGINYLTSTDIIIMDHGINDEGRPIANAEEFFRTVLQYSIDTGPAIINFLSFSGIYENQAERFSYQPGYEKVSRYYGAHFWDFFSLVRDPIIKTSPFHNILPYNLHNHITHPPWYIHVIWADLFTAALLKAFHECTSPYSHFSHHHSHDSNLGVHKRNHDHSHFTRPTYIDEKGRIRPLLPQPLSSDISSLHCLRDYPSIVNMDADTIYNHLTDTNLIGNNGQYHSVPDTTWVLLEDRPHKYGWISTFNNSNEEIHHLYFNYTNIPNDKYNMTEVVVKNINSMMIKIQYLRTYKDAGMIDIYVCGMKVAEVDALWEPEHVHISVTESYTIKIPLDIQSIIDSNNWCESKNISSSSSYMSMIEIRHRRLHVSNPVSSTSTNTTSSDAINCTEILTSQETLDKRKHQKFRLIHVLACLIES